VTTGCEVGVYNSDEPDAEATDIFDNTLYSSASDEDRLRIAFKLRKNGKVLFKRKDTHWWLTGFVLGEFSEPSELSMDIAITLKDAVMRDAFIGGLRKIGYSASEIRVSNNTVRILFDKPRSPQPHAKDDLVVRLAQANNRFLCEQFKNLTGNTDTTYQKLSNVKLDSPELYDRLIEIGKPAKLFEGAENAGATAPAAEADAEDAQSDVQGDAQSDVGQDAQSGEEASDAPREEQSGAQAKAGCRPAERGRGVLRCLHLSAFQGYTARPTRFPLTVPRRS